MLKLLATALAITSSVCSAQNNLALYLPSKLAKSVVPISGTNSVLVSNFGVDLLDLPTKTATTIVKPGKLQLYPERKTADGHFVLFTDIWSTRFVLVNAISKTGIDFVWGRRLAAFSPDSRYFYYDSCVIPPKDPDNDDPDYVMTCDDTDDWTLNRMDLSTFNNELLVRYSTYEKPYRKMVDIAGFDSASVPLFKIVKRHDDEKSYNTESDLVFVQNGQFVPLLSRRNLVNFLYAADGLSLLSFNDDNYKAALQILDLQKMTTSSFPLPSYKGFDGITSETAVWQNGLVLATFTDYPDPDFRRQVFHTHILDTKTSANIELPFQFEQAWPDVTIAPAFTMDPASRTYAANTRAGFFAGSFDGKAPLIQIDYTKFGAAYVYNILFTDFKTGYSLIVKHDTKDYSKHSKEEIWKVYHDGVRKPRLVQAFDRPNDDYYFEYSVDAEHGQFFATFSYDNKGRQLYAYSIAD